MSEANFSFTTKVGQDLLTVRGNTIDEFTVNLVGAAMVPAIGHLLSVLDGTESTLSEAAAVNTVATGLGGVVATDPFAPVAPAPTFNPSAPVAPAPTASVGDRTCQHGTMVKRVGNGARGEWRAWFCPTPKDTPGQCKPVFADKRNPAEWSAF